MATISQRVRNNLTGLEQAAHAAVVFATQTVNGSTFTVSVSDGDLVNVGDVIEIDQSEVQLYVTVVSVNNVTFVAWNGTTYAGITNGDMLLLNPRISNQIINDSLAAAAADLDAQGLFAVTPGTNITLVSGTDTYELAGVDGIRPREGVLSIYYQEASNADLVGLPFHNVRDDAALIGTVPQAVRLLDWGNNASGDTLTVLYARSYAEMWTTDPTDVEDYPAVADLLVMGATARVYDALEGPRIHDPGRFSDRTVQPGQALRDGNVWWGRYQRQVWKVRARQNADLATLPGARWRRSRRYYGTAGGSGYTREGF